MEKQNNEKYEEIGLIELVKKYVNIQKDRNKVKVAEFLKIKEESTKAAMEEFMEYIKNTAKSYGRKIKDTRDIYNKKDEDIAREKFRYAKNIEIINQIYEEKYKMILVEKLELENQDPVLIAKQMKLNKNKEKNKNKKEKKLTPQEEIELENKKIRKIRENINKNIEMCETELQNCIDGLMTEKKIEKVLKNEKFHKINERYLIVLKEKNTFTKALGWLSNKFTGAKKFTRNVMVPLKNGIDNLEQNKIPEMKKKAEEYVKKFKDKIGIKEQNKEENSNEIEVKEQKVSSNKTKTFNTLIENTKKKNDITICKMEKGLEEKDEMVEEKETERDN